jgi:hypothetical protein
MKYQFKKHLLKCGVVAAVAGIFSIAQLPGCAGFPLPPIPVEFVLVENVEIPALAAIAGSADVSLGVVCDLFSPEDLNAMVRAAAGDLIGDHLTITRVDLEATDITATEGNFDPFETATLDLVVEDSGGEALILGTAADNDGLGTEFSLTLDNPVDLLNDLEEGECGAPELHLDGAGFLEAEAITFDVTVRLMVYTQVKAPS